MVYDYFEYYKVMFIAPIVFFCFAALVTLVNLLKQKNVKGKAFSILTLMILLFVCLFPFVRGIHLFLEKEEDSLELAGVITDIQDTHGLNKYRHNDHTAFASYVYIDGEKFYIMCIEDYQIGDEVVIEYLPKSKVVLSIKDS